MMMIEIDGRIIKFVSIEEAKKMKLHGKNVYTGSYEKLDLEMASRVTYWFFDLELINNVKMSSIKLAVDIYNGKYDLVIYENEDKAREIIEVVKEHIEKLKKAEVDDDEHKVIWGLNLRGILVDTDYVFCDDDGNIVYWFKRGDEYYILDKEKYEQLRMEYYAKML